MTLPVNSIFYYATILNLNLFFGDLLNNSKTPPITEKSPHRDIKTVLNSSQANQSLLHFLVEMVQIH